MTTFDEFTKRRAAQGLALAQGTHAILPSGAPSTWDRPLQATQASVVASLHEVEENAREVAARRPMTALERILARIAPTEEQRARLRSEAGIMETEGEFRLRTLKAIRETQLQLITKTLNDVRVKYAASIDGDTAVHLEAEFQRVAVKFNDQYLSLYRDMSLHIRQVDALEHAHLRELEYARLDRVLEVHMEIGDSLLEDFRRTIKGRVEA